MDELIKKLKYKTGRAAVLHAPEGFTLGIEEEGKPEGKYDFLMLFVNNAKEVEERVPGAIAMLNGDAVFWIVYPKQTTRVKPDINRDSLFRIVETKTAYRAVSNVAVDDVWSALRFRPKALVK